MDVRPLDIDGLYEITPVQHGDDRGFFSETWNRRSWSAVGFDIDFVQGNQSLSLERGTLRGMQFQVPPRAQAKLVRVIQGRYSMSSSTFARARPPLDAPFRSSCPVIGGTNFSFLSVLRTGLLRFFLTPKSPTR